MGQQFIAPQIAVANGELGLAVLATHGSSTGWVLVEHLMPDELDEVESRLKRTTGFPWWREFAAIRDQVSAV